MNDMKKETKDELIKEVEKYLKDFDNLKDCNFFPESKNIEKYVYSENGKTLRHFITIGREYIRRYLMLKKQIEKPKSHNYEDFLKFVDECTDWKDNLDTTNMMVIKAYLNQLDDK